MILKLIKGKIIHIAFEFAPLLLNKHKPKPNSKSSTGITTIFYHGGVTMGILSISSFLYWSKLKLPICVFDDGTLTEPDKYKIKKYLNAKIVSSNKVYRMYTNLYSKYKHFLKYRLDNLSPNTKNKFDTILLSPFKKTIYIEADIVFYKTPNKIINWTLGKVTKCLYLVHDRVGLKSYERDDLDYSFRQLLSTKGIKMLSPTFNSGIMCVPNKNQISLNKLDTLFKLFNKIDYSKTVFSEETALAASINRNKSENLPRAKYQCPTNSNEYLIATTKKPVAIHYIGDAKYYLKSDVLKSLISTRFLRK